MAGPAADAEAVLPGPVVLPAVAEAYVDPGLDCTGKGVGRGRKRKQPLAVAYPLCLQLPDLRLQLLDLFFLRIHLVHGRARLAGATDTHLLGWRMGWIRTVMNEGDGAF